MSGGCYYHRNRHPLTACIDIDDLARLKRNLHTTMKILMLATLITLITMHYIDGTGYTIMLIMAIMFARQMRNMIMAIYDNDNDVDAGNEEANGTI